MKTRLQIALRDSTTATRSYVIVNPLLAKHLPSVPSVSLEYFKQLGDAVAETCEGEHVLVIGFAETATAVGAAVAHAIDDAVYVHTTRETPACQSEDGETLVTEFLEEHSHARNQALYLRRRLRDLSKYDRLVFVEDEITTGKTILNFLRNIAYRGKITVSALVFNGFDEGAFAEYDADFCCLQRVGYVKRLEFAGPPNPRSGTDIDLYHNMCAELAEKIVSAVSLTDINDKDVLVLGTEEFMYPALILGREIEKTARCVKSHSTTRTPLLPRNGEDYPLRSRQSFPSPYDGERVTYLYNSASYDTVIIVTDAPGSGEDALVGAVQSLGRANIYFVRTRNAS
ncbi:MAG: phosphoribosyltransferase family protein [Synergistaceae bacterium]|jgi:orotate phosphoribosyltransferase|nr:phosphoribosyltransferase family protein [Synergistaceae bacterium]